MSTISKNTGHRRVESIYCVSACSTDPRRAIICWRLRMSIFHVDKKNVMLPT